MRTHTIRARSVFTSIAAFSLAFVLAVSLLAGCGGPENGSSSAPGSLGTSGGADTLAVKGGYVQEVLETGAGDMAMGRLFQQGDGTVLYTGYNREIMSLVAFTSGDGGKSWQPVDNSGVTALVDELMGDGYVMVDGTVMADGTWWVAHSNIMMDSYTEEGEYTREAATEGANPVTLYRVAPGQAAQVWEVPFLTEKNRDPNAYLNCYSVLQSESGRLVMILGDSLNYDNYHVVVLDSQGNQEVTFNLDTKIFSVGRSVVKDETLYVTDYDGTMHLFDLATGRQLESWATPLVDELRMESFVYAVEEDGSLCYMDSLGLHRMAPGGGMVQNLVEGMGYAFSDIGFSPDALLALPGGEYLACIGDMYTSEYPVYRYWYDETLEINTEGQILIWAMEESHVLRAAASAFARQNPTIPVKIEYGRQDGGATDADIIRSLNTRLLADDAPDVLVLDGLPVDSYIAGGMLEDLTGLVDISQCYPNIMECYVRDGRAYGYPALFSMPSFWAPSGDSLAGKINTLADLADLAEGDPDNLVYGGWGSMFDALYAGYSPLIFPDAASVDEEALREFLDASARIAAALPITAEETYEHGGFGVSDKPPVQGVAAYIEKGYGGPTRYCADIVNSMENGWQQFLAGGEQYVQPLPGKGYIPVCGVGVPTGAGQKEGAVAFIQTMLDEDGVQFTSMEQGFAVKKSVNDEYFSRDYSGMEALATPGDFDWDGLIAQYEKPAVMELQLKEKLWEQAQKLYGGGVSLDGAVSAVVQSTKTYFAERAV